MKRNMGTIDKIVRIFIAVAVLVLYLTHLISGVLTIILLIISGIFILTSLFSFCPVWWTFGISTANKKA